MRDATTPFMLLTLLAAASGGLAIVFDLRGSWRGVYLFKPLTMLLIVAAALVAAAAWPETLREGIPGRAWPAGRLFPVGVLAGLAFSIAGDVFLMLRRERFVAGLLAFLGAHLCYGVAFAGLALHGRGARGASWPVLGVLLVLGAVLYRLVWPGLGPYRSAVAVYLVVILGVVWMAASAWVADPSPLTGRVLAGALLFMTSDSALALDRFRRELPAAPALVLGTYFPAQWFLAWSLLAAGDEGAELLRG